MIIYLSLWMILTILKELMLMRLSTSMSKQMRSLLLMKTAILRVNWANISFKMIIRLKLINFNLRD